jgi:hypothetical protein
MFDCKNVSRQFHQSFVSSKTRKIFEAASSNRPHSSDQLEETVSLSIEMSG